MLQQNGPTMASDFTEAERRQFHGLMPHIQRALQVGQKLEQQDLARRTALAAIDALSFGIIVVDAAGRAILMNRVAEGCFRPGQGIIGGPMVKMLMTSGNDASSNDAIFLRTERTIQSSVRRQI